MQARGRCAGNLCGERGAVQDGRVSGPAGRLLRVCKRRCACVTDTLQALLRFIWGSAPAERAGMAGGALQSVAGRDG